MAAETMKPAYLFAGDDETKIDEAKARLRKRAESEGGAGALEAFEPLGERSGPDAEAFAAAVAAMSLTMTRRYVLADGVDRWKAAEADVAASAVEMVPEETTIVLLARGKAPARLVKAVEAVGGKVTNLKVPAARELPAWVAEEASKRGLRIDRQAAGLLVERMGANRLRLGNELDRLALWAGEGGMVTVDALRAMVTDTTEAMIWSLSDAVLDRDAAATLTIAEQLVAQQETVPSIVYQLASRLRQALQVVNGLEEGRSPKELEGELRMHPYAAKKLVARVRGVDRDDLRTALTAVADLELWTRGGADYGNDAALTLALRRATGVAA